MTYLLQNDNGLTLFAEPNGQFTVRREDYGQQVELDEEQARDLVFALAARFGLRLSKAERIRRIAA